jgi:PhnB protein
MPTHPYIHFQGQCAEALTAYAAISGAAAPQMMRYADGPGAPEGFKGSTRVMHGQLAIHDGTLMASDYPPGMEGDPQRGFSVMQSVPDVATGQRVFAALAEGGAVIEPFEPSFFAAGFGMVQDRFGTHWIITAAQQTDTARGG